MDKAKKIIKKSLPYMVAFLLPIILLGLCLYLRLKTEYGNLTIFFSDMTGQYIPLFKYLSNVFDGTESLFYSFSKGIGGNMFGTVAYYLTSPLNLLFIFANSSSIPIITIIILLIKVGLAGLFMYIFLSNMLKKKNLSLIIFSTCYALSAYMINYYFCIMWLDCVYLLPLIMLGIHRMYNNKSSLLYITSLMVAIISNYYIGYMVCIFSCIYFIYEIVINKKSKKELFKCGKKFIISSVLAGFMTMVLLIPMCDDLMSTARAIGNYKGTYNLETIKNNFDYLSLFKNFILGTRDANNIPLEAKNYYNIYIYCGLIILPLMYFYFINKKINKREKIFSLSIIVLFLISYSIKYINYIWHGFAFPNGFNYRFAFLFIFYFIFIAAKSFYEIKEIDKKYYYYFAIIYIVLLNFVAIIYDDISLSFIYINLVMVLMYLVLLYMRNSDKIDAKNKRDLYILLPLLIFGELFCNSYFSLEGYFSSKLEEYNDNIGIYQSYIDKYNVKSDKEFYRMNQDYLYNLNQGLFHNYNGFNSFLSTTNKSTVNYFQILGYGTYTLTHIHDSSTSYISDSLLGLKYNLSSTGCIHSNEVDSFDFSRYTGEFYNISLAKNSVCENPDSLGLGYLVNKNIKNYVMNLTDEFTYLNMHEYMLNSMLNENNAYFYKYTNVEKTDSNTYKLVTNDSDYLYVIIGTGYDEAYVSFEDNSYTLNEDSGNIAIFKNNYKNQEITIHIDASKEGQKIEIERVSVFSENTNDISASLNKLKQNEIQLDHFSDTYIKGNITVEDEDMSMLFLSIPYEGGWAVYVDGNKTEIEILDDTFMGVPLTKGKHTIELKYETPGLKLGACISGISLVFTVIYLYIDRKKRKESQIMLEK